MKKLWFKAKRFGYGWYPVTWQGWLVLGIYLFAIMVVVLIFRTDPERLLYFYLSSVFFFTALLVYICFKTGEKPSWRWGRKK